MSKIFINAGHGVYEIGAVCYVDSSYVYLASRVSIRGDTGQQCMDKSNRLF